VSAEFHADGPRVSSAAHVADASPPEIMHKQFRDSSPLTSLPPCAPEVSYRLAILTGKYMVIRLLASYGSREQREDSSGNRRRLGHITKQVSSMLRFLLVEAARVTARSLPEWRSKYFHLAMRRGRKIAKVAMARRLAIVLYWMWHKGWDYEQVKKFGSHAGQPGPGRGA
jgi:transposase